MSWFKRKNGSSNKEQKQEAPQLPDLPQLPTLPPLSLPDSEFSPIIKQELLLPRLPGTREFENGTEESIMTSPKITIPLTRELSSGREVIESKPRTLEISETPFPKPPKMREEKAEPIFIRIDKYQEAVQAFHEIKAQLNEIETYLKEIRELKQKEERELEEWENQIGAIKARLNNIDQGVFGKLS